MQVAVDIIDSTEQHIAEFVRFEHFTQLLGIRKSQSGHTRHVRSRHRSPRHIGISVEMLADLHCRKNTAGIVIMIIRIAARSRNIGSITEIGENRRRKIRTH